MIRNPIRPHRNQRQIDFLMLADIREVLYGGSAGGGKALHVDTPIPTPTGWKNIGDLLPGNSVFGMEGRPIEVLAVSDIMHDRECWLLTFDDGSTIVADAEHRWLTYNSFELSQLTRLDPAWREARRKRRKSRVTGNKSTRFSLAIAERNKRHPPRTKEIPKGSIRTTSEIAETLKVKGRTNHAIPVSEGLKDLPDAKLLIDPYVLGCWLGDGTSASSGFTSADVEIVENIRRAGYVVGKRLRGRDVDWIIGSFTGGRRVGGRYGVINTFAVLLRKLGVLNNKHVPSEYLRGSRNQRLALLQGLMDTDGTVCKKSGAVEFVNTNKQIVDSVAELACSLGHKISIREGRARLKGKDCGPKWMVKWTPPEIVFRLKRKADLQRIGTRRTRNFRYIVSCERVDSVPVRCIQVAAQDGMFLAGRNMVPTHNSEALLMAALQYVEVPGYAAIIFRKTYADLALPGALMDRAAEILANTSAVWNGQEKTWTFPSGATLTFGYLDSENDRFRYQSSEFQYIAFDELTQFKERDYRYLFSRLRRKEGSQIPLRMRAGTNPGGIGHLWVKKRFDPEGRYAPLPNRRFVSAKLKDNPYLDEETYKESLQELDSQTRKQLEEGDWTDFGGNHYHPDLWPRYHDMGDAYRIRDGDRWRHIRKEECSRLLTLDWAMGKPKKDADPSTNMGSPELTGDCTAFVVADMVDDEEGLLFLLDAVNERIPIGSNAPRLAEMCRRWEPIVVAGDDDNLTETMMLECRRFREIPTIKTLGIRSKNKLTRSQAAIVRGERGKIYLPYEDDEEWVELVSDQLASFTGADGNPDDVADAISIMGRLADEFRPGEDQEPAEPVLGADGYQGFDGEGW